MLFYIGFLLASPVFDFIAFVYLVKRFYNESWMNSLLAFTVNLVVYFMLAFVVFLPLVILWQLGVFNAGQTDTVVTGFVKMQPLTPAIAYSGSRFTALFTNALGATANITDVDVKDSPSGTECSVEPLKERSIRAGGTFTVQGNCGQKNAGDAYDLVVTISYSATMGGISTNHTDTGHIKGRA
jgi:hypothetical protein